MCYVPVARLTPGMSVPFSNGEKSPAEVRSALYFAKGPYIVARRGFTDHKVQFYSQHSPVRQ